MILTDGEGEESEGDTGTAKTGRIEKCRAIFDRSDSLFFSWRGTEGEAGEMFLGTGVSSGEE